jgi:hypothetical protein
MMSCVVLKTIDAHKFLTRTLLRPFYFPESYPPSLSSPPYKKEGRGECLGALPDDTPVWFR